MAHPAIVRREEDTAVVDDDDLSSCISSESEIVFLFFSLFSSSLSFLFSLSLSLIPSQMKLASVFLRDHCNCLLIDRLHILSRSLGAHSHWCTK